MQQLSTQDAQFLYIETGNNLTHVMGVNIFDPSTAPGGKVRLKDIIEAAIGPIAIADCVVGVADCMHEEFCSCRNLWALINRRICLYLEQYTLEDMLSSDWPSRVEKELESLG